MNFMPEAVGTLVAHRSLLLQKHAPAILFAGGMAGFVGTTVLACKATLKLEDVLETAQSDMKTANALQHYKYTERDRQKDIAYIYVQSSMKIVKLYAPAVIVGGVTIIALTKSHNILSNRVIALTAAYSALEKGFDEYRQRVIVEYGEDKDREFRYGTQQVEVVDPETKKKELVTRVAEGSPSIYARFFDQYSTQWSKEPEYNLIYIKCQQNYANDLLKARGHVFLNEVYDMLGIERSQAGAVIGWILSKDGDTDNYIDFGIFDDSERTRDFVNGREGSILLDFNVDGVIFDKIGVQKEELSWQKS
jgi:hypothetical protein